MKEKMIKCSGRIALGCFLTLGINTIKAQVGIPGNNPDKSSVLDLTANNKGFLMPRLSLVSLTDKTTINGGNPAKSLLVYNTNTSLPTGEGFYYWDSAAWKKLVTMGDADSSNIVLTNTNYTVTQTDYTIVAAGMTGDITITLPDAATNKGRILVINQNNVSTAAGAEITVKFNVPVKYSDKVSKAELLAPYYSAVTGGTLKISLQSDGTNWFVISSL